MFSIWFSVPLTGSMLEVKADNLKDAQLTWDLIKENFYMVSERP
jgi:hypothetical protein